MITPDALGTTVWRALLALAAAYLGKRDERECALLVRRALIALVKAIEVRYNVAA